MNRYPVINQAEQNLEQRIRYHARLQNITAKKSRRDGLWYFSDERNWLISPEQGLGNDEAMKFIHLEEDARTMSRKESVECKARTRSHQC